MSGYVKNFDGITSVIETELYLFPAFEKGKLPSCKYFTNNAVWDTGAEITLVSKAVIEALGIKPSNSTMITGVGGDFPVEVYDVAIGLPNGKVYHNYQVYSSDSIEYDVLIGMDIITECDFCFTNKDHQSVFSFRNPSEEKIILK